MRTNGIAARIISLLLAGLILSSCARYSYFDMPKEPAPTFEGRVLLLYYPELPTDCFQFSDLSLSEQQLSGKLERLPSIPKPTKRSVITAYLNSGLTIPDSLQTQFQLPLSDISRMEAYDVDLGKTILATTGLVAGISLVAALILYIVVILTKESCPFIYTFNGEEFEFIGEIYSGAIFPNLERDDYMALPFMKAKDGEYQLKMANQAEEIQYTNLAELSVVDHPLGTSLLADSKGKYHTLRDPQPPLSAVSGTNEDVLDLLKAKDEIKYLGDETDDPTCAKDAVVLQFAVPKAKQQARLVLRARNSIWLDHTMGQFLDMFGSRYDTWYARQSKPDAAMDPNWSLNQGIPLSVYLKRDGEWQLVDYFPVVGPMADRDLVMPIDLSGVDTDSIELKLECGPKFWEIDYVALDTSVQEKFYTHTVTLKNAVTTEGKDVTKLLKHSDKHYFVQPRVGDSALLCYPVPAARETMSRTVFLHSRGHYKVIRKAKGEPDVARLEQFRQPGSFALFSRRNYLELMARYALKLDEAAN